MAKSTYIDGDVRISGDLTAATMQLPNASVTNLKVAASANIEATKLEHQHVVPYSEDTATVSTDKIVPVHAVYGATGQLVELQAGSIVPCDGAGAEVVIDLLKNGTTVLTTPITLTTSHTAYQVVNAVIGTTAVVTGDVLEIDIDAGTAGTAALGIFASIILRELAV